MKYLKKELKILEKLAKKIFNLKKLKYKVKINLKSSLTIGRYERKHNKNTLRFNKAVYKQSKKKTFHEVIVHEFSHMVAYELYGPLIMPHGKEWKSVMRVFGENNPSAKTKAFSKIKMKESDVSVKCKCGSFYLSANRGTRLKNGTKYTCRVCSKKIKLI